MSSIEELVALAGQLKAPQGEKGISIAEMMNETNIRMTQHAIDKLNLADNDKILELGHGNCGHLKYLIQQKQNLIYYGLETAELMQTEAERLNKSYLANKQASFTLYNGSNIPFDDGYFDKVFTVNTIYFWSSPTLLLSELYRVLKVKGLLNITYAQKSFMEKLPFTKFGFELYDCKKLTDLLKTSSFKIINSDSQTETVKSKAGDWVEREFTTVTLEK